MATSTIDLPQNISHNEIVGQGSARNWGDAMQTDTPQMRQNWIIEQAEILMQEDIDRFDSVVRKLLTMLSHGMHDLTTTNKPLRPYGLAKGKVKIPEDFYEQLSEDEISLFEGK